MKVNETTIQITTDYIKLEALLKYAGITVTGGMAKNMIENGEIQVNGAVCLQRGRKLYPGDSIMAVGQKYIVK